MEHRDVGPGLAHTDRVLITGATGLIGQNLLERLRSDGLQAVGIGSERDLRDAAATSLAFERHQPTYVFHLAARVGGIYANTSMKSAFYSDNVLINTNVINACAAFGVRSVFAMGTGCAYPKRLEGQLLREESFLDGIPETTNDSYAYAKRGLLVHLEALRMEGVLDYAYCIPANIYGPHDNFHPLHSHVVPALVRRFCDAADVGLDTVTVWGSGEARRDFLYVDDCIEAIMRLARIGFSGPVNVGTGTVTSVATLALAAARAAGFSGRIEYDRAKPEGQTTRLFDLTKVRHAGWQPHHSLDDGLTATARWYRANRASIRER